MKTAVVYLHANKEGMWELGEQLGLTGEALQMFRHACTEVKVELSVDETTGEATIVKVDDRFIAAKFVTIVMEKP